MVRDKKFRYLGKDVGPWVDAVEYFIESVVYMGEQNLVYYAGCKVDPIEWVFQAALYVPPFHQSQKTW